MGGIRDEVMGGMRDEAKVMGGMRDEAKTVDLHSSGGGGASSVSSEGPGTHNPESIHFFSQICASSGFIVVSTSCSLPISLVSKQFWSSWKFHKYNLGKFGEHVI